MNLRDKIGQRIVVAFKGTEVTPQVRRVITECRAGGVILFSHNIESLEQVRRLNQGLQQLAKENGLLPLIISVDEEGGRVTRMPLDGMELIAPSQMAQGAADKAAVRDCALSTARRLSYLGFNLDYTPVLDVNNNPANPVIGTRSYGSDPQTVAELGEEAVTAFIAEGVAPCAKHFPGHGDTDVDSHLGLPIVNKSLDELCKLELVPFQKAVAAGIPAIMTAHIIYPQIEPDKLPVTLSPFFLGEEGILRREFGFNGVIFTDALVMNAIADSYGLEEASVIALKAGADIVMPLGPIEAQISCYQTMLQAAERGEIEIEASLSRIMTLKEKFCQPFVQAEKAFNYKQEEETMTAVARRSLTLLRNQNRILPFVSGKFRNPLLIDFEPANLSAVEERRKHYGLTLYNLLARKLPELSMKTIFPIFADEQAERIMRAIEGNDAFIIVCRNTSRNPRQAELVQQLLRLNQPTVIIATRDPYDLEVFGADALVATYAEPNSSLRALAGLLAGEFSPQGRLPVDLPSLAERGAGLNDF